MVTFVLVHGSSCGGWIWQRLTPLLRASGHECHAPTLSGLSDRAHLLECGINLTTHIRDIASLLFSEDLSDVVLVGNSYAGMVITGVAATAPERLGCLVYLDAYLPDDGQSEFDLLPAGMREARQADAMSHGGVTQPPPLEIFGVVDPVLREWMTSRMTPHPWATYTEPVPSENAKSAANRIFVHCTGNPPTTPDLFGPSAAKAKSRGWPVYELAEGHAAMITAPERVAELLLRIVA